VPAADGLFFSGIFNDFETNNGNLVGEVSTVDSSDDMICGSRGLMIFSIAT
jgi:hypothetical protein